MNRLHIPAVLLLLALVAPAFGQGVLPGIANPGGFGSQSGGKKASDDLLAPSSSNPGVAPPLDIRIQGEGLSLPTGVSEDDQPAKPAAPAASAPATRPQDPPPSDARPK